MIIWKSAMVRGGNAKITKKAVTRIIHGKRGIRISVMPGARMLMMVTIKFIAVTSATDTAHEQTHQIEVDAVSQGYSRAA